MKQSNTDPCVFTKEGEERDEVVLVVHGDDIFIGGKGEKVDMVNKSLDEEFPTNSLGKVKHVGCCRQRLEQGYAIRDPHNIHRHTAGTFRGDTFVRYHFLTSADLESITEKGSIVHRPYHNAGGGVMW